MSKPIFTRAVILAGGEGSRLGTLTAKRTKPAVPFAGKYRIIDFALSNCVNSGIFDVMIIAQYRPHSLIDHIGAGGPWDLNRDFTGGVRIFSPYKARGLSEFYAGTADAVQQNFRFIKDRDPDMVLILSGDHIYEMNYDAMIAFHNDHGADLTMATIRVPISEASRFGIVGYESDNRVTSFVEKPSNPPSDLANMGVYLFNTSVLDRLLWDDHKRLDSSHDFGKDILPRMIKENFRVFAFPYSGYWVDVGTVSSYWKSQMDLLKADAPINLNDRSWIIHTRTEERPPVRITRNVTIIDGMLSDGCVLEEGCVVERSVLSPGVHVGRNAILRESIILTGTVIEEGAVVERTIADKRCRIGSHARVGGIVEPEQGTESPDHEIPVVMLGKKAYVPSGHIIEPGAVIGPDVVESDYPSNHIQSKQNIYTKREAYEV